MTNVLVIAKELIRKGQILGDPDLIQMGYNMLEEDEDEEVVTTQDVLKQYQCSNCQHTMPFDKEGRKKCPECKKHCLELIDIAQKILGSETKKIPHRATAEDFTTQIRQNTSKNRIRYDENGKPDGIYARTEQVEGVTNVWNDDKTEGFDDENEKLKKFTKVSPRTRKPVAKVKVVCENCRNEYRVHPIHAGGRGRYLCDKCITRRSKV